MSVSKLSRILDLIQEADDPISLGTIAHQLEISPQRAESMLHYWIRKGRISQISQGADCRRCGINGSCPFVIQFPTSYQLVDGDE